MGFPILTSPETLALPVPPMLQILTIPSSPPDKKDLGEPETNAKAFTGPLWWWVLAQVMERESWGERDVREIAPSADPVTRVEKSESSVQTEEGKGIVNWDREVMELKIVEETVEAGAFRFLRGLESLKIGRGKKREKGSEKD